MRGDAGGVFPGRYRLEPEDLARGDCGGAPDDDEDRKNAPADFLAFLLALYISVRTSSCTALQLN